eukprot:CAMPEP_0115686696 /NCGR_PEP_ID=MMETSP0272-20121206/60095_2 /TAXON_ID=71861 /ORGANISM="Scrippsiella trochoidea, Strain CCMP3099" /LENGTH=110 /DNA_ID=CAMNT_0003126295 /DNA_START=1 /DNA_END=330 /DNA_ORIENTATION=-
MGAGKGGIDRWVAAVRPGFVLFELDGVSEDVARAAMRKASFKLPCQSKFVIKKDGPSLFELGRAGVGAENKRRVDPRTNPTSGGAAEAGQWCSAGCHEAAPSTGKHREAP